MGIQELNRIINHDSFENFSDDGSENILYLKKFLTILLKLVKQKTFYASDYFAELTIEMSYKIHEIGYINLDEMITLSKEIMYLPEPIRFIGRVK